MISIRAKTTIKIATPKSKVDYGYMPGTPIETVAKDMIHTVIQSKGTPVARVFIEDLLNEYDPDFKGVNA